MSEPYIGQLLLAAFNFAPKGYAFCNGQTLQIQQNSALFSLIGTYYGGDGVRTFLLPNLQGRTPVGYDSQQNQTPIGQVAGTEYVTLIAQQVPAHTHNAQATSASATQIRPAGSLLGTTSGAATLYTSAAALSAMNQATVANFGGSQPHENRQPFLVMNWCIALVGIFPSRS